jgi:hypothetical protein
MWDLPFQTGGILKGVGYSIASFHYALTGLCKRNTHITFTVLTKANSRRHSHANIEKFGSEFHRIAHAINPNIKGCFGFVAFVADFAKSLNKEIAAFSEDLVVLL